MNCSTHRLLHLGGRDKHVSLFFYELLELPLQDKMTFPRIVAACMHSLLHIPRRGPQRTCLSRFACVHVPLLAPDMSPYLMGTSHCSWVYARAGWGWGSGCRLLPDSSSAVGLRTFAAGYLECCRDRGARSYRPARQSVPREPCQRGQEEKTHSSNTQWVRACTLMSYLQSVFVCIPWHVNRVGRSIDVFS